MESNRLTSFSRQRYLRRDNRSLLTLFFLILAIFLFSLQGSLADVLRLPSALEDIDVEAFSGDSGLDEVKLPEGIESIGSRAFINSSLRKINLPSSLSFIANDAFDGPGKVSVSARAGSYAYKWAVEHKYLLAAPTQNATGSGYNQITVNWKAVDSASGYLVYYGTANSIASATEIDGITETSYTITGLANGTTYYTWVKAKNDKDTSISSNMKSATTAPGAPGGITLNASGNSIALSWDATPGATIYRVNYSKTNDFNTATKINNIKNPSYVLTGLDYNTTYYIWLEAANPAGGRRNSGAKSATTGLDPNAQPVVTEINLNDTDNYQFAFGQSRQMTATVKPDNAVNKTLRWVKDSGTDGVNIDSQTGLVTATKGGRIKIHAEATDGSGVVSDSLWLYCIPSKIPTISIDRVGRSTIQLSWDEVPGAVGYRVSYKPASASDWETEGVSGAGNNFCELDDLTNTNINPSGETTYHVRIMAYSVSGNKTKSSTAYSTAKTVNLLTANDLEAPDVTVKTIAANSVTLTLKANGSNTAFYYINYYDDDEEMDEDIEDIPVETTTIKISGLEPNTKYHFDVFPQTWDGGVFINDVWDHVSATTKAGANAPNPPTGLSATAASDTSVKLTWTASSNASGYYVRRGSSQIKVTGKSTTTYTYTGLNPNTKYTFYVSAYNSSDVESERVKIQGTTSQVSLGTVTGVHQTGSTSSSVSLGWNALTNATSFDVYWRATTAGSGAWDSHNTDSTSYTITGLVAGNSYEVCVVGKKGTTRGTQSDSVIMSTALSSTIAVTKVTLDRTSLSMTAGGVSEVLTESILPNNASNKGVTWTSSDISVATVSNGIVTPKAAGTATITVKTNDGSHTATCSVKVSSQIIKVENVSLNKVNTTLGVGGATETLTAQILPSNATYQGVSWSSSNTQVVTVSSKGVLTPKAAGNATITVTTDDGNHSAACQVKVIAELEISENPASQTAANGSSVTMRVTAAGGSGSYTYQWYRASNLTETGAKVSTSQNYTFTVSSSYDGYYYYCTVTSGNASVASNRAKLTVAAEAVPSGKFENGDISITQGETKTFKISGGVTNSASFVYTVNGSRPNGSELGISAWAGNIVSGESSFSKTFAIDATSSGDFYTAGTYTLNLWVRDANATATEPVDTVTVTVHPYVDPATMMHPISNVTSRNNGFGSTYANKSYTYGSDKLPRKYHLAIDYVAPVGQEIVAFCAGTVKAADYDSANGNFVVIQHTISSKTVYSFYAHMSSLSVSAGKNVTAGQKIGVIGDTGSAAGTRHLHFSVVDTLDTSGSYWGYSTEFTGNAVKWLGVVFYDPDYIIETGMLPTKVAVAPTSAAVTAPDAPTQNAPTASGNSITLSWNDDSKATGFTVYYSDLSETNKISVGKCTSWTVPGLKYGTKYYTWLTASNSAGESAASVQKSVTTGAAPAANQPEYIQIDIGDFIANGEEIRSTTQETIEHDQTKYRLVPDQTITVAYSTGKNVQRVTCTISSKNSDGNWIQYGNLKDTHHYSDGNTGHASFFTFTLPEDMPTGTYLVRLYAKNTDTDNNAPFICLNVKFSVCGAEKEPILPSYFDTKVSELKEQFKDGKYWNHVGISAATYKAAGSDGDNKYNLTCTTYACDNGNDNLASTHMHGSCNYYGACGCNSWGNSIQCMGYAKMIGELLTGTATSNFEEVHSYNGKPGTDTLEQVIRKGDVIRVGQINGGTGHSFVVVGITSTGVAITECNWVETNGGKNCLISWTTLTWSSFNNRFGHYSSYPGGAIYRKTK